MLCVGWHGSQGVTIFYLRCDPFTSEIPPCRVDRERIANKLKQHFFGSFRTGSGLKFDNNVHIYMDYFSDTILLVTRSSRGGIWDIQGQ